MKPNGWDDITFTASAPSFLNVWIDFNIDGDWDDAGERVFSNQPLVAGANHLSFWVPYIPCLESIPGDSFARFRFFTDDTINTYDGYAPNGEVEDYMVPIGIPVGGEAYPVHKASILLPWIALAAVIASVVSIWLGGELTARNRKYKLESQLKAGFPERSLPFSYWEIVHELLLNIKV